MTQLLSILGRIHCGKKKGDLQIIYNSTKLIQCVISNPIAFEVQLKHEPKHGLKQKFQL